VTLVLVDDTLAIPALIAPSPLAVEATDDPEFLVTYSMWQRVLDAIAKGRTDPAAPKGQHLTRLRGLEHLAIRPDPARLRIVNPVNNQWPAALRKAQRPWSNALRADWATAAEAVTAAGGTALLSNRQAKGLHPLWPDARIAQLDFDGAEAALRIS